MAIKYPRWLIDDTTGISEARIFVAHLEHPRFAGELLPAEKADLGGITVSAPGGQVLCKIHWFAPPVFDPEELAGSLAKAIDHYESVRGINE